MSVLLDGYLTGAPLRTPWLYINQALSSFFLLDGYLTGMVRLPVFSAKRAFTISEWMAFDQAGGLADA
jgi:hypothetical protein